jgi:parallel beta-helix repeat protein
MLRTIIAATSLLVLTAAGADAKTFKIKAGPEAEAKLQAALSEVGRGDTISFGKGRFDLQRPIVIEADKVMIRGAGPDRSVLSFHGQVAGGASLAISGDDALLRDFAIENPRSDGILATGVDKLTVQNVRVNWIGGPRGDGSRGVSAVASKDVMIDRANVSGASDAGILLSQSENAIIRRSSAKGNTVGIRVENSAHVDVLNNVANGNSVGIMVGNYPGFSNRESGKVRVVENEVVQNNLPSVARDGEPMASMPPGVGVYVMAISDAYVSANTIGEHASANVVIAAYREPVLDPNYNPLPRDISIVANTFGRTGFAPPFDWAAVTETYGYPLPDILWDGAWTYVAAGMPKSQAVRIGVSGNVATRQDASSFLSLGLPFASSPMSEVQPNPNMPSPLQLPMPPKVKIK